MARFLGTLLKTRGTPVFPGLSARGPSALAVAAALACASAGTGGTLADDGGGLRLWHRDEGEGHRIEAANPLPVAMTVKLDFGVLENLAPVPAAPGPFVVPAGAERVSLLSLSRIDPRRPSRFEYRSRETFGDYRSARHDDAHLYWLPFSHGTRHHVGQGYGGAFSHNEPGREHAIDFDMPEGTLVTAAREGVVVAVKDDSDLGGPHPRYRDSGNFVAVFHADGSFAEYVHLAKGGARVRTGDRVRAGDPLAASGNTGFSNGPHLHFQVSVPTKEGVARSVPTRFLDPDGNAMAIEEGRIYVAYHPGKGPLPPSARRTRAEVADYASHRAPVPLLDRIETREERHDGVVILYLRNGYNRPVAVQLEFPQLENLGVEGMPPGETLVDARSERFIALLRPARPGSPYRYRVGWRYRDAR